MASFGLQPQAAQSASEPEEISVVVSAGDGDLDTVRQKLPSLGE